MDIFNNNRKLEQVAMYGIDWGMFIRHNIEETTLPFAWLFDGEKTTASVLMTDENPFEYAMRILETESKAWQQVVIGVEGFLKNEQGEKVDALIVQAFDASQEKGVSLGQMFIPKEQNGTFSKLSTPAFLGHIDLPFPAQSRTALEYEGTKPGYTNLIMKDHSARLSAGHQNPSVVGNIFKMFIRSKFNNNPANMFTGEFRFDLFSYTPDNEFAKYTILNAIKEEQNAPASKAWEERVGKKIQINVRHGQAKWLTEINDTKLAEVPSIQVQQEAKAKTLAKDQGEKNIEEFNQSTRSNIEKLKDTASKNERSGKPWWKFW